LEGIAGAGRVGYPLMAVEGLEELAYLIGRHGAPDVAARLLGAADAARQAMRAPLPPYRRPAHDSALAALRSRLGEATYGRAWTDGRAMPLDRAIEYAQALGGKEFVLRSGVLLDT